MRKKFLWICILAATSLHTTSGCGPGGPPRAPVSGKITVNGQPVPSGRITFYPTQGRPAMGAIRGDGTYELTTFEPADGALLGGHIVTIKATQITGGQGPQSFEEESRGVPAVAEKVEWLVPQGYSDRNRTPLTAEVKPQRNTINFEL